MGCTEVHEKLIKSIINKKEPFEELLELVNLSEAYNANQNSPDIILEYIQQSGNCQEILNLVKNISEISLKDVLTLLKTLYHILIRVATDLTSYSALGVAIVNNTLNYGMKTLLTFLNGTQKSSRAMLTLHLLTSMVMLGSPVAHSVFAKLNISSPLFIRLFNRRNKMQEKEEDVRACFLHLIMTFLSVGDNSIVRQFVELKGFLNEIFPGLQYDKASIIDHLLSTLQSKVVDNPSIRKTSKIRLFSDSSLKCILNLLLWNGPRRMKTSIKRKLGEDVEMSSIETDQKEIDIVRNAAFKFMHVLCCSHKSGIIFRDHSIGTSGRNFNCVITQMLMSLPSPYANSHLSELFISILKVCPDQTIFYLPSLKDNLAPRFSTPWFQAIGFLKKIVCSQDPLKCLLLADAKKPVNKLVLIAKAICVPDVISGFQIVQAIKDQHPFVVYHLLDYFSCILKQVQKIANFCKTSRTGSMYSAFELTSFYQSFIASFMNSFPLLSHLRDNWIFITSKGVNSSEIVEMLPNDTHIPNLATYLRKCLEIIILYDDIHPDAVQDISFPELFIGIKNNICNFSREELCYLQLKLMEFIANQRKIDNLFLNSGMEETPLGIIFNIYVSSEEKEVNENWLQLMYKLLRKTNFFHYCEWEMDLWLTALKQVRISKQKCVLEFFEKILCILFNDPNKFLDEILECQANHSDFVCGNSSFPSKVIMGSTNQLQENYGIQTMPQRQCFSPLVPASLFILSSLSGSGKKACKKYLEMVLRNIVHHQSTIKAFFTLAEKHQEVFTPALFDYWKLLHCQNAKKIPNQELLLTKNASENLAFSHKLQDIFVSSFLLDVDTQIAKLEILATEIPEFQDMEIFSVSWQLLMYINIEVNVAIESQRRSIVLHYINILDNLLSSTMVKSDSALSQSVSFEYASDAFQNKPYISHIKDIKDIISHPFIFSWFLRTDELVISKNIFKDCSNLISQLAVRMISYIANYCLYTDHKCLLPFKTKVVNFCKYHVSPFVLASEKILLNSLTVDEVIKIFWHFFSSNEVVTLLRCFLFLDTQYYLSLDPQILIVSTLLEIYLKREDYVLMEPVLIVAMFKTYCSVKEGKQKNQLRELLLHLLRKHPLFVNGVPEEICGDILEQQRLEDIEIIGIMLTYNGRHRKHVLQVLSSNTKGLYDCNPIFLLMLINRCVIVDDLCSQESKDYFTKEVIKLFSKALWKVLKPDFDVKLESDFCQNVGNSVKIFVQHNYIALEEIEKRMKKIEKKYDTLSLGLEKIGVLLEIIRGLKRKECSIPKVFVNFCMKCLTGVLSSSENMKNAKIVDLVLFCSEVLKSESMNLDAVKDQLSCEGFWTDFLQKNLKIAMKSADLGPELLAVVTNICKVLHDGNSSNLISVSYVYDLVTGHSKFFQIILDEGKMYDNVKGSILDLLILLVQMNKEVCKDSHVSLFLSSYHATLSSTDQKLLYLIKLYEECGINMSKFSPFLWGKAAISHYSVKRNIELFLWKQPKLEEILSIFHVDKLIATAVRFPLLLKLEPSYQDAEKENKRLGECVQDQFYDPRFVLPLLSTLLSPGSFVSCHRFIESKVLVVIFASLSSYDSDMRAIGYHCLSEFYSHLESSELREKVVWISLMDSIKNSIGSPNARLPSIITLFLVKSINILTKPDDSMYVPLYKFITIKPTLDIEHVPDFYTLFGSIDIEHCIQRNWIISLIAEGLRSSLDFHLCQKRYIFTILLPYFTSSLCTPEEKVKILQMLSAAASISSSARTLYQSGLLPWLHNAIDSGGNEDEFIVQGFVDLIRILWSTALKHEMPESFQSVSSVETGNLYNEDIHCSCVEDCIIFEDIKGSDSLPVGKQMYLSFLSEMLLVQLSLLKKLSLLYNKALFHYLHTLHSIVQHIQFSMPSNNLKNVAVSSLSLTFVMDLCNMWTKLDETTSTALKEVHEVNIQDSSTLKEYYDEKQLQNSDFYTENCHKLFSCVILLWKPSFRIIDEFQYAFVGTQVLCCVYQLLNVSKKHPSISSKLSDWLLFCLCQDKKRVMVKFLLSKEEKAQLCLKLILENFENSLKDTNCNKWTEILQLLITEGISDDHQAGASEESSNSELLRVFEKYFVVKMEI